MHCSTIKIMLHYETICKADLYTSEDLHFSFINLVLQAPNWGKLNKSFLTKTAKSSIWICCYHGNEQKCTNSNWMPKVPHKIWGKVGRFQLLRINYLKDTKEKPHGGPHPPPPPPRKIGVREYFVLINWIQAKKLTCKYMYFTFSIESKVFIN